MMMVNTVVLVHSPLVGPETWDGVVSCLSRKGIEACNPSLAGVDPGPEFWAACAHAVQAQAPDGPALIVGHSGIGPILPYIAEIRGDVVGAIYADASLPTEDSCWLEGFPEPPELIDDAFVPNMWTDEATWALVGIEPQRRAALAANARLLPLSVYQEPYPVPPDWRDLPSAYLAFVPNPFYEPLARKARDMGWPTRELAGAHFHMLVDPGAVTEAIQELAAELGVPVRGDA
jgi:pimeloyl-ACP methyl ester carboxylesterase